jgi:homoserine O-acetyltransferase
MRFLRLIPALALALALLACAAAQAQQVPREGEFVIRDFRFHDGRTLPALRIHYATLGSPVRGPDGHVRNAVLILHGTGGSGRQFLRPQFADVLFRPGGLLDARRYFIILPDGIGHGKSSKPSDGMRAAFPDYDYDDMVAAQYDLLTAGLGVDHLRLVMGTSMGCMHAFVWGETRPRFMDALMPLACLPVEIAGRNRIWREMIIDAIRSDPAWQGGNYAHEPAGALRTAADILLIAGSAPLVLQRNCPTRDAADAYLHAFIGRELATEDANDLLYQVSASRDYDPSARLGRIVAPVMWVNSADDFINPPELGIAERMVGRMPHARFVLLPISDRTHGHGTHTWAEAWQDRLAALLADSAPR